jgi:transmembrane sensor
VLLSAGEQLAITSRATPRPTRANVAVAMAWTQHQLILEDAPLSQVAEEFNRYSARKLVAEDHGEPALRLSGVFSTDPRFLIRYLRERPDIVVTETSTEVRIVRELR